MLCKLAEKDASKKNKDDDNTKEVEINDKREVTETYNDELVVNAANDAPPPQGDMTTTTATACQGGLGKQ